MTGAFVTDRAGGDVADDAGGRLRVARQGPRSVVVGAFAASPLRLLTPSNHGHAAWIFTSTYGGGLLGGDEIRLRIDVERGATALLQTQASTKVYGSPRGAASAVHARVEADGLLLVLPDPTVPFAGASYRQEQHVDLDPAASLVLLDWVTAGRRASGERWAFDRFLSRLTVRTAGARVLAEALLLSQDEGPLARRMGRFECICLIAMIGPAVADYGIRAIQAVGAAPAPARAGLLASAAPVGDGGCVIRLAGTSVEEVGRAARDHLGFVPALLGDDPWARKW